MYNGYNRWDIERARRLEECHAMQWKSGSRLKRMRPLCGARCRDGHACRAKAVVNKRTDKPLNGRCRMHGGLSTGTKTPEGKERSREAARRGMLEYWKRKKAATA